MSFGVIFFMFLLTSGYCKIFRLEADNARTAVNHEVRRLQNASDGRTVMVNTLEPLSINFCIREKTNVRLSDIRFSHINVSALFTVRVDHSKWMGTYFSPPSGGFETFISTGNFPKNYNLDAGWHVLKIHVNQDSADIAVDFIELDIADERINLDILQCTIACIQEAKFPFMKPEVLDFVNRASISQQSFETKCAEVDNVNIPIYNPHVTEFSVTAKLPQYKSFANRRHDNLTNCPHLPPELWAFTDFTAIADTRDIRTPNSTLMFTRNDFNATNSIYMVAYFKLEGEKMGSIDAKIGNELYLDFQFLNAKVTAKMQYRGKSGKLSQPETRLFDKHRQGQMWRIPDFTWTEDTDNFIVITLESESKIKFDVKSLRLVKRPMVPEQVTTIYRSDDVIIETVDVQLSWLAPRTMKVRLTNGVVAENVTFLRFYRPIPWHNGYAQVMVLYNDANVRLLPTVPEGCDWIPFGTSVIIGQTKTDTIRPYAVITDVNIDPEQWEMKVFYEDGNSAKLKLNSTDQETQLFVTEMDFLQDPYTHPFATVRSMYVDEGNTDVDSVKVDDRTTYNIMDKWGSLSGKSFAFHRRCISTHLTLSPDIQIDMLRSRPPPQLLFADTHRSPWQQDITATNLELQ